MTPFTATVRSEFTKLLALRSTKIQIALAMALGVALSALLAWILGMTLRRLGCGRAQRLRADRRVADRRHPERDLLPRHRGQGRDGRVRRRA